MVIASANDCNQIHTTKLLHKRVTHIYYYKTINTLKINQFSWCNLCIQNFLEINTCV